MIKKIREMMAIIGRFLLYAVAMIARPSLFIKLVEEAEIAQGKIKCPKCQSGNINAAIVPVARQDPIFNNPCYPCYAGSEFTTTQFNPTEKVELNCRDCGAKI